MTPSASPSDSPQSTSALPRFFLLYAMMYAGFGVASPFLPAFLEQRGISAGQLGFVLGAATAVRLIAGPIAGRMADLLHAPRNVLTGCLLLSASMAVGYAFGHGMWVLATISVMHAAMLAPVTILSDALALIAAKSSGPGRRFEYGWVRGVGSAAFIAGTLLSGLASNTFGLASILWLQTTFLLLAAFATRGVPEAPDTTAVPARRGAAWSDVSGLLKQRVFPRLILFAALVLGSHALNDGFSVIRWTQAGIDPLTSGVLWAESVAAEVLVFFVLGPLLVHRLGPAACLSVAAVAAIIRWSVMAVSVNVVALGVVQPLHGLTFALLHLAAMRIIAGTVPVDLMATAQAMYGTVGIGAASALITIMSGWLYAELGGQAFWVMAALCLLALPISWTLRRDAAIPTAGTSV